MKATDSLQVARIDPTAFPVRLLPWRDRDGSAYRVELGDAMAYVEAGDRLRIPYIRAEGDVRMSDLLSVLTESVGCHDLRFVEPRTSDDDRFAPVDVFRDGWEADRRIFARDGAA